MKTAIAYTRVSSDDQIKGTSLGTQLAEIKTYCAHHGLRILAHYEDAGESAKTADRPGLITALDECRKRKASHLVVHRLDRLSRNASDGLAIRAKLSTHGTQLVSVSEPVSDEPAGQFLSAIMFAAAQFDNDLRSARSRSGMSATMLKGGWTWKAPTGFKEARREDGLPILSVSLPCASELSGILNAYAGGSATLTATIRALHAIGFDRNKASKIFKQPIYGGVIRSKLSKVDIPAAFPCFVTPEQWYRIEGRYAEDMGQPRRDKQSPEGFPLTVCACSVCGSRLKGSNARSATGRLYPYYRCPKGHANVRAATLDTSMGAALAGLAGMAEKLTKAVEIATARLIERGKDTAKDENRRTADIKAIKSKLASLAEKYVEGDIDQPTYRTLQTKYNGQIGELQAGQLEVTDAQAFFDMAVSIASTFRTIGAVWARMNAGQKRNMLNALPKRPVFNAVSEKVELDPDQFRIDENRVLGASEKLALLKRLMSNFEAVARILREVA